MQTSICPKCKNSELVEDAQFCWKCGFELGNYCDNPNCPNPTSKELPDPFIYCPYCGTPTHYTQIGFLQKSEF